MKIDWEDWELLEEEPKKYMLFSENTTHNPDIFIVDKVEDNKLWIKDNDVGCFIIPSGKRFTRFSIDDIHKHYLGDGLIIIIDKYDSYVGEKIIGNWKRIKLNESGVDMEDFE